jgi:hypothetical protein
LLEMSMKWERLIMGEPASIEERRTKIEIPDKDIEKEMEELMPLFEEMYRDGILTRYEDGDEDA